MEEALIHTLQNGDDLLRNERAKKENWSKEELLKAKELWNTRMSILRAEFIDEQGDPAEAPASEGMIAGFVQVPKSIEDVNSELKQINKLPSTWRCTTVTRFIKRVKSSLNQSVVSDILETILLYGLNPKFVDEMNEEEQARYWSRTGRGKPSSASTNDDDDDNEEASSERRPNVLLRGYAR